MASRRGLPRAPALAASRCLRQCKFAPSEFVEPLGSHVLYERYKKTATQGSGLFYMASRRGFEPLLPP